MAIEQSFYSIYRKGDKVLKQLCRNCGQEFEARDSRHLYCSAECRESFNYANRIYVCTCLTCGKEFQTKGNRQQYCSHECRQLAFKAVERDFGVKQCAYCGKNFIMKSLNQKYCSSNCAASDYHRIQRKQQPPMKSVCLYCGETFTTTFASQMYCSFTCKTAAANRARRNTESWFCRGDTLARRIEKSQARQASLETRIKQANECGLSYGNYVAQLRMGKTYEELKALNEKRKEAVEW